MRAPALLSQEGENTASRSPPVRRKCMHPTCNRTPSHAIAGRVGRPPEQRTGAIRWQTREPLFPNCCTATVFPKSSWCSHSVGGLCRSTVCRLPGSTDLSAPSRRCHVLLRPPGISCLGTRAEPARRGPRLQKASRQKCHATEPFGGRCEIFLCEHPTKISNNAMYFTILGAESQAKTNTYVWDILNNTSNVTNYSGSDLSHIRYPA